MSTDKSMKYLFRTIFFAVVTLLCPLLASAELAVAVSPVKVTSQKAIVPLTMKNGFDQKIESARAVVFLLDEHGKTVGQPTTRWVIGGNKEKSGLPASATNSFHFVITTDKPFATTNLTVKVNFTRVVLEGGKLASPSKDVHIQISD